MIRTIIASLLITVLAAPVAHAGARNGQFGVSLRIAPSSSTPLAAANLPMPADSRTLATNGATRFEVMTGDVSASRDYFLATLPAAGFTLQAQSLDDGHWQSLWRDQAGSCTEILAEPVVGAAVARVRSTRYACA